MSTLDRLGRASRIDCERAIVRGWERLDALRREHGYEAHAYMLAGWALAVEREIGEPSPRFIALNAGMVSEEEWPKGVAIAVAASGDDVVSMETFLRKQEARAKR